jgi:cardiolipin synthase
MTLWEWLLIAVEVGLRLFALGVIPGNRKPSTGMAWLLLILVEPIIGFAIFLLVGRIALSRGRMERKSAAVEVMQAWAAQQVNVIEPPLTAPVERIAQLNERLGALPIVDGNTVAMREGYAQVIQEIADEVDRATSYVHIEFYIVAWDEVTAPLLEAMSRAAARGVTVRLLFDHLGSLRVKRYRAFVRRLRTSGIAWQPMLPLQPLRGRFRRPDLRNHRKIALVDGRIGWTGSLNLIEPGYHRATSHRLGREWVELMVRVEGPVTATLNGVFASDWYAETGEEVDHELASSTAGEEVVREPGDIACQVVPSGPGLAVENNLRMFTSLLYLATERISITSPYFVPDESLLYAVTTAAQRGIPVELFVSEDSDQFMVGRAQASYYRALLEAGVRIHRYPSPAILHSKHLTIDSNIAVIGSSNMDMRSFALNYEVTLMLTGGDIVPRFREVEDTYRSLSRELTLEEWRRRPRRSTYVDNAMRLTSALQ